MEFEWDFSKELENFRKHGIDFTEASECFFDQNGFRMIDKKLGFLALRNGGNLGGYIMKEPKLSDLKIDERSTKKLRREMAKTKKIKITINFDADILDSIKTLSKKTGIPYQSLTNRVLREALQKQKKRESRLDRLEKEIEKIKKKIAA